MKKLFTLSLLAWASMAFGQGSLTPLSGPTPTMRSLDQVEPRTPIPGGSSSYTISTSGSYKLTGNLNVASGNAIVVMANDVTLDLGGFTVTASGGAGVYLNGSASNVTIRHGIIRGCTGHAINGQGNNRVRVEQVRSINNAPNGIYLDINAVVKDCVAEGASTTGIYVGSNSLVEDCQTLNCAVLGIDVQGNNSLVNHCTCSGNVIGIRLNNGASTVTDCALANSSSVGVTASDGSTLTNLALTGNASGISAGKGCTVKNCSVFGLTTGAYGISAGEGSTLSDCAVSNSTVNNAISLGDSCSLVNCSATRNTGSAANSAGFSISNDSTVVNCTASYNTSTAAATHTTGQGFVLSGNSQIINCTAAQNRGDGIALGSNNLARGNSASGNGNGSGADGSGIYAGGLHNVIDDNTVIGNVHGIDVVGLNNLITRNRASLSSVTNYVIFAGCVVGPIVAPATSGDQW